jgi:hypothetical protein
VAPPPGEATPPSVALRLARPLHRAWHFASLGHSTERSNFAKRDHLRATAARRSHRRQARRGRCVRGCGAACGHFPATLAERGHLRATSAGSSTPDGNGRKDGRLSRKWHPAGRQGMGHAPRTRRAHRARRTREERDGLSKAAVEEALGGGGTRWGGPLGAWRQKERLVATHCTRCIPAVERVGSEGVRRGRPNPWLGEAAGRMRRTPSVVGDAWMRFARAPSLAVDGWISGRAGSTPRGGGIRRRLWWWGRGRFVPGCWRGAAGGWSGST